jgi:hypothetical protein
MRAIWIAALIVAGLLIATNPSRDDFNSWAQTYAKKKIEQEAAKRGEKLDEGESAWGGAIAGLIITHMPIERRNFLAFSIYSVTLPAGTTKSDSCSVLGVAGQFLPLGEC